MQNLLRGAAEALDNLAEKAHQLADRADNLQAQFDPDESAHEFAGVDIVGIDFSTSIVRLARHVIRGWDRYRNQVETLRPDHGIWAFGVNAVPFYLTRKPVPPRLLPRFSQEHFRQRGDGQGLIEYGSAFHDYFFAALQHAQELDAVNQGHQVSKPITISLLCDGCPNGGLHSASDVRPLIEEARGRGVRFKLVVFTLLKYWRVMWQLGQSLGLADEELEVLSFDEGVSCEQTIDSGFELLSRC
jgi:hypothetical protein